MELAEHVENDGRDDQPRAGHEQDHVDTSRKAHEDRVARIEAGEGTDEDHRLVKQYRGREAQEKSDAERGRIEERDGLAPGALGRDAEKNKEGEPSPGNSSGASSGETGTSASGTRRGRQKTAPTTEPFSSPTQTDARTAGTADGSGTANR